jgi:hypothetical protein
MSLVERWNAEETKLANLFKKLILLCGILGGANEYIGTLPTDWIPQWVKITVLVAGIIGFAGAKMTIKQPAANPQ